MPVLAGLARPAQRPKKGGQKRGLKWPFAVINASRWVILEVKNGSKMAQKGVIFGTPFWTGPVQKGSKLAYVKPYSSQNRSKTGQKVVQKGVKKWSKMAKKWVIFGPLFDHLFSAPEQLPLKYPLYDGSNHHILAKTCSGPVKKGSKNGSKNS